MTPNTRPETGLDAAGLLPCPMCGGDAAYDDDTMGLSAIICGGCRCNVRRFTKAEAVAAWNRRAPTAAGMHVVRTDALDPRTIEACAKVAEQAAEPEPFEAASNRAADRKRVRTAKAIASSIRALIPQEQA